MISRLIGAVVRGILVLVLIATPAVMVPVLSEDTTQVIVLVGLAAAILTTVEYAAGYPCLYEFRDAPPFNRVRFVSLFATVFLLSVLARGTYEPSTFSSLVHALGNKLGAAIDFPYSPVRLVVLMMPEDFTVDELIMVRAAAALAYAISLVSLIVFFVVTRIYRWPLNSGSFNVWVNLPTFDPTSRGDVVERLERDGRINVALGFLLPFLIPAVVESAGSIFGSMSLDNPQTLIWTVAAWAFLPASLFARGMAMGRVAAIIARKRRESTQAEGGMVPA